jgi:hypothetical protein
MSTTLDSHTLVTITSQICYSSGLSLSRLQVYLLSNISNICQRLMARFPFIHDLLDWI